MKPYLKPKRCLAAAALILLAACSEDIIGTDEAPQPQDTVIPQEPDVDLNDTDDNIANTSFDRTVKVIFSDTEGATVQDADGLTVTVSGNDVTINNQSKKRTFVVVNGDNSLADGATYTDTPSTEDEKAAYFSEGQLIFSGTGSLTVTAVGKSGISSDNYVRFMSCPTVKVNSTAGHGVRGKDYILVSDGSVEASTSASMKKGF